MLVHVIICTLAILCALAAPAILWRENIRDNKKLNSDVDVESPFINYKPEESDPRDVKWMEGLL